jgi:hypothetical protein
MYAIIKSPKTTNSGFQIEIYISNRIQRVVRNGFSTVDEAAAFCHFEGLEVIVNQ